jgi:hypothetical protein
MVEGEEIRESEKVRSGVIRQLMLTLGFSLGVVD